MEKSYELYTIFTLGNEYNNYAESIELVYNPINLNVDNE